MSVLEGLTPSIKFELKHDIYWPIIVITVLRLGGFSDKIVFLGIVFWLVLMTWQARKIIVPRVKGLWLYTGSIILSILLGMLSYQIRDVVRDVYYVVPTVIAIIFGYYCGMIKRKNIRKTIYLSGFIISAYAFWRLITDLGLLSDFGALRGVMGTKLYEVCAIFGAMFIECFVYKKVFFSKWADRIILMLMMLQISLSLGRSAIIQALGIILTGMLLAGYYRQDKMNSLKKIIQIVSLIIVVFAVAKFVLPQEATEMFAEKWENNIEEMDSSQEFDSTADAMHNWRAYEIQCAKEQWKKSNILVQLIGEGFGTSIQLKYVPYNWEFISGDTIPLLHNGCYTMLPKGGLLGVAAMLWIMIFGAAYMLLKYGKSYRGIQNELIVLVAIGFGMACETYVTNGMVAQSYNLAWGLLVGIINYDIVHYKSVKSGEENK